MMRTIFYFLVIVDVVKEQVFKFGIEKGRFRRPFQSKQ